MRSQNGNRTRAHILDAARKEFAAKGFDGARVEAIARRARVAKGLIFYYFQSKEGLFRALAEARISLQPAPPIDGLEPNDPLQWPLGLFGLGDETLDWVRFFLWEGMAVDSVVPELLEGEVRGAGWQRRIEWVRGHQSAGRLPADLDAGHLTLLLYILGVYPYMVPQLVHLVTGTLPTDPQFRRGFETFVRGLGEKLQLTKRSN